MTDPFGQLGLDGDATAEEVRRARRELAKEAHPDAGGDAARMQTVNAAAAAALRAIDRRDGGGVSEAGAGHVRRADADPAGGAPGGSDGAAGTDTVEPDGRRIDAPSFTVEALPVETFEGLLVAAAVLGEIVDDDPPYELTVLLAEPLAAWCRLHVVPDAGASTVSLAVAPVSADVALPPLEVVRDAWIAELNRLDWSQLS